MAKFIIIYETRYGNTKLVAEKIAEGIRLIDSSVAYVSNIKKVDVKGMAGYDAILIGGPTHFGTSTRKVNKFIEKTGKLELVGKAVAVFATYIKGDAGRAVDSIEAKLRERFPGLNILEPGLSVDVTGMKGPVSERELARCAEFGKKVAGNLISSLPPGTF